MSIDNKALLTRRNFIKAATGVGLLAASTYWLRGMNLFHRAQNSARILSGSLPVRYVRQIITGTPAATRRIMWEADAPLTEPAVEFRQLTSDNIHIVRAADETFTDDGYTRHQYGATISELQADTDYEYRLVSADAQSDWFPLHTAPMGPASYKLLIFPDSQSSDYSDWARLAQDAWNRNPDAQFFVNMGDLVDNGEDHTQWQAWFDAVSRMISRIPIVPLMGNHETYDQNWKVRLPEAYLHYFDVPENHSERFSGYYYSFDYGMVHFIVLNSQWDETNAFKQGLLAEQCEWLQEDAHQSAAKWKVVLIHKDVLQYRSHKHPERQEGISAVGEALMPLFDQLGIDIVFTAHLHTYRNRGHLYNNRPSEKRGPLYLLTGVAGNVRYPGLWIDHAYDRVTAPQPETDNYLTMAVTSDQLSITCYLPDGTVIDHVQVNK